MCSSSNSLDRTKRGRHGDLALDRPCAAAGAPACCAQPSDLAAPSSAHRHRKRTGSPPLLARVRCGTQARSAPRLCSPGRRWPPWRCRAVPSTVWRCWKSWPQPWRTTAASARRRRRTACACLRAVLLVPSPIEMGLAAAWRFGRRQYQIAPLFLPRLYALALAAITARLLAWLVIACLLASGRDLWGAAGATLLICLALASSGWPAAHGPPARHGGCVATRDGPAGSCRR